MFTRARWFGAALTAAILVGPAMAQPSPLSVVPGTAPIVVQMRGWERSLARLNATLKAAAPDFAPRIAGQIESGIAEALMGRELKGLAKDGPMFLVFTEVPGDEMEKPEAALVVRVSNYVQFRDGLLKEEERKELKPAAGYESTKIDGKEVFFLSKGDYAVLTPSQKALKLFQDKKATPLAGKLDKVLEAKLLDADLSVCVDMAAINKKYGDQIAQARAALEQAFEQAQGLGATELASMGFVKNFYAQLFQLVEDSERVVAALDFPPEGFSFKLHTQVGDKSKTNELLKGARPVVLADLGKLPGGAMYYAGGTLGKEWMQSTGMMFMFGAGAAGGKDDKAVADAAKELQGLKIEEWSSSMSLPAANIFVGRYKEPSKAAAATLKLYRAVSENGRFGGLAIKGKPEVKADAQKLGAFTLHHAKLAWDFDKMFEQIPEEGRDQFKEMMNKLMGADQQVWFGSDGRQFVEVSAKDWPAARKLLEDYLDGKQPVSTATGFAAARKRLPERAALVGTMNMASYTQTMYDAMAGMLRALLGADDKKLNAAEGPPAYLGFALGLEPRNVSIDLWIPADGVKQVLKMLAPFLSGLDG